MNPDVIRTMASFHALLAWSSAAALSVAAGMLAFGRRRASAHRFELGSAITATALASAAFATGASLDLPWRLHLRQRLFLQLLQEPYDRTGSIWQSFGRTA